MSPGELQEEPRQAPRDHRRHPLEPPGHPGRGNTKVFYERLLGTIRDQNGARQPIRPLHHSSRNPPRVRKGRPPRPKRALEPPRAPWRQALFATSLVPDAVWQGKNVGFSNAVKKLTNNAFRAISWKKQSGWGKTKVFQKRVFAKKRLRRNRPSPEGTLAGEKHMFFKNDARQTTSTRKKHGRQKTPIWTPKPFFMEATGAPKGPPPGSQKNHRGAQDATRDVQFNDPEAFGTRK